MLARVREDIDMTIIAPGVQDRHRHFFIDGRWASPSSDETIDVDNSGTGEIFATVASASAEDVDRAIAAARRAFDDGPWPQMSHAERGGYLRAIAAEMDARSNEFADTWSIESGVVNASARVIAGSLSGAYSYYAGLADSFAFEEQHEPKAGGNIGLLVREPVGVVAAIVPWNSPARLMSYKCAPALLAGCTVIVKASPEAPCNVYLMAEICEKVGLPPGVFNVITAHRDVSELLVRHADVDKVTFTGSTAAGRRIAAICGDRIARCTLELGGKSAALVLDDYDVELAARTIGAGATYLTGQACSALSRVLVSRHRHDAFVEALSAVFKATRVGDPFAADTQMGPLATRHHRERVERYIATGQAEGATLAAGGQRPAHLNRGYYVEPTVFGNVDNRATIAREEIFGPVLAVVPVDSDDQMVAVANDSQFGLNASIFTPDSNRAYAVARQLRSGTVGHNAWRSDFSIAFGGFKQSGIGREGGVEGLLPFLETKTVVLDAMPDAAVVGQG